MTVNISITPIQVESLRQVYTQCLGMAERSPTVAAILNITAPDIKHVEAVLNQLPKLHHFKPHSPKNGNDLHPLQGHMPAQ